MRRWRVHVRLSLRAMAGSRARTALSAGGVAVGIAPVVVLLGAGAGAERAIAKALDGLGRNLLAVNAPPAETGPLRRGRGAGASLTLEDWQAIRCQVPGVLRTAPVAEGSLPARVGGLWVPARVTGTTPAFRQARSFPLAAGRFIDEDDLRRRRRVAVVGPLVVDQLFRGESPLGERLLVRGVPFRIVGVTRRKGISAEGADEDDMVIIPLTTAMRRLLGVERLVRIYVQAVSAGAVPAVQEEIASLLQQRHGAARGASGEFSIQDQTALIRARRETRGSLSRIVTGLAALALGLAGTGLMAVSLLSVRERTPEIGLRLAVGGRPRDILWQFLSEAAVVSVLGGLAGLAAGWAGIEIAAALTLWPMALSWQAVVYPLAISAAIAVAFGAYPALRAARLDPIMALNSR